MSNSTKFEEIEIEPENEGGQSGYVIAMTALLLVPMIVIAAFAVDVGSWYADSIRLQRAADAAALAAVVYMPKENIAHSKALEVAAQNGFVSDVDENGNAVAGGNSTLTFIGDGANVRIEIETKGKLFFGQVFLNDVDLARTANAEYIEPVRMGNPTSGLGTGNLTNASDVGTQGNDGFWLAVNHPCWPQQHGDPFSMYYFTPGSSPSNACASGSRTAVPQGALAPPQGAGFDGYVFIVDMPAGASSAEIEIRNPGKCTNNSGPWRSAQPDLTTSVYTPDNTLMVASDNLAQPPVATPKFWDASSNDVAGMCGWQSVHTVPSPGADRKLWYVKVEGMPTPNVSSQRGLNPFSLRVRPTATTGLCSSMTSPTCPNIYALEWLPIYRPGFGSANVAEFFLSDVGEQHAEKTLELTLFDPGEGMREIQILHPDGTAVDFEFRMADTSVFDLNLPGLGDSAWANADNGCTAPAARCLDVTGSRFQGRTVQIRVDLAGYTCQVVGPGTNCWWKVRYIAPTTGSVTDRTTWRTRIIGDPIRLTE